MLFKKSKQLPKTVSENIQHILLSDKLNENVNELRNLYKDCDDLIYRSFLLGGERKAMFIYFEGLADIAELNANVLGPLLERMPTHSKVVSWMESKLHSAQLKTFQTLDQCINKVNAGSILLLVDKEKKAYVFDLKKWEKRNVEEPSNEMVVKGPREGFTESIGGNVSMLRRRLKSSELKIKTFTLGRDTQTDVSVMYMKNLAGENLVEEVCNRISRINIDGVIETQYIEELIEDQPFSPFPQILNTERPDTCAAGLLEGRVAILVDGSPSVMIAPVTLASLLQSSEDFYQRFILSSAIRQLRFLYVVISLLMPSLYVAVLSYHQEMLPTKLILSISATREVVPFPAVVEALIMEVTFEALREAGLRLPKQIGSAVSIAGAVVIGEAAIQAGIVSPPMVMVVALTGIASFTIPHYNLGATFRLLRFPMIILAGTLGLLGIMFGLLLLLTHAASLRSFGMPYLSPAAPAQRGIFRDLLVRAPMWMQSMRPHLTGPYNKYRQAPNQKPGPEKGRE